MAFIAYNTHSSPNFAQRIAEVFQTLVEKAQRRAVYRTTYNELSQLSARELGDMGMNRSMIRQVALDAAYGPRHD